MIHQLPAGITEGPPQILFVLHGHLPFVHHPEYDHFLEEDWLFEAIADCYLPLLAMLDGWEEDSVEASFTLGLSPPLLSMLALPLLRERAVRYLRARQTLSRRALEAEGADSPFRAPLLVARDAAEMALTRFEESSRDLALAFAHHHDAVRLELMTCGATHGLMPVLLDEGAIQAQVAEAIKTHERHTHLRPRGIWLPECGVTPLALDIIAEAELVFTFCEDRGVRFATPPPIAGPYRPIYSPHGVAFFARDPVAAREVWSAQDGYPVDFRYREFYRDLGYDADEALLGPEHIQGTGLRKNVGVKLHRITGSVALNEKAPYNAADAADAIDGHCRHFVSRRQEEARRLQQELHIAPCMTASFDAELFGHWWHEGPRFLDGTIRLLAESEAPETPRPVSAWSYLETHPTQQVAQPAVSSWGEAGSFAVWVNGENDWLWRKVHDARQRLGDVLATTEGKALSALERRAVDQAAREVMLAESSDWPFILAHGTQTGYGRERPLVHLTRAHRLLRMVEESEIEEEDLNQIALRDNIFPDIDPGFFRSANAGE